jgi:hypothetical protein
MRGEKILVAEPPNNHFKSGICKRTRDAVIPFVLLYND